jgi:chemotaxis protein CheC
MSLPSVIRGSGARLFEDRGATSNLVLLLYVDFIIRDRNLQGFIALLMDLPAITTLKLIVRDFIKGIDQ